MEVNIKDINRFNDLTNTKTPIIGDNSTTQQNIEIFINQLERYFSFVFQAVFLSQQKHQMILSA